MKSHVMFLHIQFLSFQLEICSKHNKDVHAGPAASPTFCPCLALLAIQVFPDPNSKIYSDIIWQHYVLFILVIAAEE